MILVSLLLNVLLLGGIYWLSKGNVALRRSIEATRDALVVELNGMKTRTADNGTQIASIQTQMVTADVVRAGDRQILAEMRKMGLSLDKRITDITLINTVTEYKIKDTLIVVTDSSYVTDFKNDYLEFKSTVYPSLGYSQTDIKEYYKLIAVGHLEKDTTRSWPFRFLYPRVGVIDVTTPNPNAKIEYLRHLKLERKK